MLSIRRCLWRDFTRLFPRLVIPLVVLVLAGPGLAQGEAQPLVIQLPLETSEGKIRWDLEIRVLRLINRVRVSSGLAPLTAHDGLRRAARAHALDMLRFAYLSHQSRDGRGPQERARSSKVALEVLGENVGYAANIHAAHGAFMASKNHRRMMLTGRARLVGIGVVAVYPIGVIIVQDFGH